MTTARAAGRALAQRHQHGSAEPATPTLIDYAEVPRSDDWSLRSALVRVAQRDPARARIVLEVVRRCDAALHPHRRALETHGATTDRALELDDGELGDEPADPAADARAVDLARLVRALLPSVDQPGDVNGGAGDGPGRRALAALVEETAEGYRDVVELEDAEVEAMPILVAALDLDHLAELVAQWAVRAEGPVPEDDLDRWCRSAWAVLDAADAPVEDGRPPPGARSRRS